MSVTDGIGQTPCSSEHNLVLPKIGTLAPPGGGGLFDPLAASITTYLLNVETAYVLQGRSPCDVGGEQMNKFKTQTNNKKLRFGGYASPCDKMFSF